MFFKAVVRARLKLIEVPARLGDPNNGNVEIATLHHRLQSREDLFIGEIARGAKENKRVRLCTLHMLLLNGQMQRHGSPTHFKAVPIRPSPKSRSAGQYWPIHLASMTTVSFISWEYMSCMARWTPATVRRTSSAEVCQ